MNRISDNVADLAASAHLRQVASELILGKFLNAHEMYGIPTNGIVRGGHKSRGPEQGHSM